LPFWLFIIAALYLYFVPITGANKVSVPFFVLLLISLFQERGVVAAILFGVIFYFILLIKDLLIIDRRTAHEILVLVLGYLLVRSFFLNVGGSFGARAMVLGIIVAWAMSAMATNFIANFSSAPEDAARETRLFRRMLGWATFILMWQLLIVGSILPLDFLYQSAIVFLIAVILLDLVPQYVFGELWRTKVLAVGTVLFSLLVIVLASARWGL